MFAPVTDDLSGLHRYRICVAINNRHIVFEFDGDAWLGSQPYTYLAFCQPTGGPFAGIGHHLIGAIFDGTTTRLEYLHFTKLGQAATESHRL